MNGHEVVQKVERYISERDALLSLCREILATLSLEKNYPFTIGSPENQEWVIIWRRQLDEIVDGSVIR